MIGNNTHRVNGFLRPTSGDDNFLAREFSVFAERHADVTENIHRLEHAPYAAHA